MVGYHLKVVVVIYERRRTVGFGYNPRIQCNGYTLFYIDSLYAQTYTQLELLFVDDCSTDKSLEIINNCINDYSGKTIIQAKILRHEVNRGVAAAKYGTGIGFGGVCVLCRC